MSVEEKLKRVEYTLELVVEKLHKLETILYSLANDPANLVALELATYTTLPAQKLIRAIRVAVSLLREAQLEDPVSRAIIETLVAQGDGISISELTRRVRAVRGSASRRVIAERLRMLESRGVLELRVSGRSIKVYLKKVGHLKEDS